jgi:hypothetical protein
MGEIKYLTLFIRIHDRALTIQSRCGRQGKLLGSSRNPLSTEEDTTCHIFTFRECSEYIDSRADSHVTKVIFAFPPVGFMQVPEKVDGQLECSGNYLQQWFDYFLPAGLSKTERRHAQFISARFHFPSTGHELTSKNVTSSSKCSWIARGCLSLGYSLERYKL